MTIFLTFFTRKIVRGQINKHDIVKIYIKAIQYELGRSPYVFDAEMTWDGFKLIFHSVLDALAPIKEIRFLLRTEPWMNSEILQNIRHRDETLNTFRKTKDPALYKLYY